MKPLIILFAVALTACSTAQLATDLQELSDGNPETGIVLAAGDNTVAFTGSGTPVRSYRVWSFDSPENDPAGWILSGSDNGKRWKELDKKNGVIFCSRFQEELCVLDKPSDFKYYRLKLIPAKEQGKIALSEVEFSEKNPEEGWSGFVYPEVEFRIDNPESKGAKMYSSVVHDPEAYAKFHARKVAEMLFNNDRDSIRFVHKIKYILRDFDGVAYKAGSGDMVEVNFSTRHIEKSAAESLYKLDFETRGVLYHELVHGYQYEPKNCGDYGSSKVFWSFIEGMADAVRAQSGHFDMNTRRPGGNWLDGYRTTGFFIQWMTRDDPDAIRRFHKTALDLDTWSWDAAIKALYGPEAIIESKWEEYQNWLRSPENRNQIRYDI